MIRATAANGFIRAFAATTKDIAQTAADAHKTTPVVTAALGRTLTAGAMMGLMMKGDKDIMTIIIKGDGPIGGITVTADSHGNVKGYPENPKADVPLKRPGKLDVGGAVGTGSLTVIKDLGLKEPYTGTVELVNGEIAEDITYYFAASEQVPSAVGLGVLVDTDRSVRASGGFIIQLMPGVPDDVVDKLEKKVNELESVTSMLDSGMTPEDMINNILGDFAPEILEKDELHFYCNCSKDRMAKALISLGARELSSLIAENEPIELKCHFCESCYSFEVDELKEMLEVAR